MWLNISSLWTSLGNNDIIDYLVAAGANVSSVDSAGQTPLHITAGDGISWIYVKNDQVNLKVSFFLLVWNRPTAAEALILHGADVNSANNAGETPLYLAVKKGNFRKNESNCNAFWE